MGRRGHSKAPSLMMVGERGRPQYPRTIHQEDFMTPELERMVRIMKHRVEINGELNFIWKTAWKQCPGEAGDAIQKSAWRLIGLVHELYEFMENSR
jgi:hypothetical protein